MTNIGYRINKPLSIIFAFGAFLAVRWLSPRWVASPPLSGQGIAIDPVTPHTIIGIDRAARRLLIATRQRADHAP